MQYWIIYQAGIGGDGFANLIEHASNITPADKVLEWREHYRINHKIKFYSCAWAQEPKPFRQPGICNAVLNAEYVNLVTQRKNTVIPVHYYYWNDIDYFEHKNTVTQDQIKIHLYSSNLQRAFTDAFVKNKLEIDHNKFSGYCEQIASELKRSQYDCHIDIEQVWDSWNYLEQILGKLDITLSKDVYRQYMELIHA